MLRRRVASDDVVGIFLIAAQDQKLSENIAQKLSANPSWRPNFFSYKNFQSGGSKSAMESILRILAKSENPATRDEIAPYTILLVRAKESARALKLWNDLFPSDIAMLPLSKPGILQWPAGDRFQTPLLFYPVFHNQLQQKYPTAIQY